MVLQLDGQKLGNIFPPLLVKFFEADGNCPLPDFDIQNSPWCQFKNPWPGTARLIRAMETTNWTASEFTEPHEEKITTVELFAIKDASLFSKAKRHDTPEMYDSVGCDVVPVFEPHRELIENLMQFLPFDHYYRIYVNIMHPGDYLMPHKGLQSEYAHGLKHKISIPLNLPPGFRFKVWGAGDVPMEVGRPVAVNTSSRLHAVINDSHKTRYMLHVKGRANDVDAYAKFLANQVS